MRQFLGSLSHVNSVLQRRDKRQRKSATILKIPKFLQILKENALLPVEPNLVFRIDGGGMVPLVVKSDALYISFGNETLLYACMVLFILAI
jgi:hypothetical protein